MHSEIKQSPPKLIEPPKVLSELIAEAGISFNGQNPWDIQIHSDEVYQRILTKGSTGFGEAYMDGLWDTARLDELFYRLLKHDINNKVTKRHRLQLFISTMRNLLRNPQSVRRAFDVGKAHYDIGNDVFEAMLDPSMSYSCGYWHNAANLQEAQTNKLELICRKLELRPGERLLDIGCGFGGMARHAAQHYGVKVVGITVSKEQRVLAMERCRGLPIEIELMDYRHLTGEFDKIVSVGMFEHVGPKNYKRFFEVATRLLTDEGLFLLHTIGDNITSSNTDPWTEQYIFPNGKLPSALQLAKGLEGRFLIEDWHNFGQDYDLTLMAWWENFDREWANLQTQYNERFYRMWKYYLMSCAGMFRARQAQLWQLVLSKRNRTNTYRSIRT